MALGKWPEAWPHAIVHSASFRDISGSGSALISAGHSALVHLTTPFTSFLSFLASRTYVWIVSFSLLFIIGKRNKKVKRILLHTSLGCWKRSQGDGDVDRQGMNDDNSISNYSNGYKVNRSKWKMNDSSHLPRARFNSFPVVLWSALWQAHKVLCSTLSCQWFLLSFCLSLILLSLLFLLYT